MPAARGERRDGGEMLPRQNFGRRHERRLAAGLDDMRRGKQRDDGLAGADVAVQQPQHALRLRQIGDDVGDGAALRRRERIGQRRGDACAQAAFGGAAAAGAACAYARAAARARAGSPAARHRRAATRPDFAARYLRALRGGGSCATHRQNPAKRCARARPHPAIPAAPAGDRARASIALCTCADAALR